MTDVVINDETGDSYQIIVVNIKYDKITSKRVKDRPDTVTLDVPSGILKCKDNTEKFLDAVEQFAYNTISKKYGAEVCFCQVWLPLEEN